MNTWQLWDARARRVQRYGQGVETVGGLHIRNFSSYIEQRHHDARCHAIFQWGFKVLHDN